jgi:FAD/FMN-containing dehydrogenase
MSFSLLPTSFDNAVAELRARVSGAVFMADDDGYDTARAGYLPTVDQHPAVIVVPEEVADVAEAVRFARAGGLRVAIQATGHGTARPADDAVLIVTARLDNVTIDPAARTAYVAAGAQWSKVLAPAQEYGLALAAGSSSGVGAVGYTLGGGRVGSLVTTAWSDAVRLRPRHPDGIEVRARPTSSPSVLGAQGWRRRHARCRHRHGDRPVPVTTVYAGNLRSRDDGERSDDPLAHLGSPTCPTSSPRRP